MYKTHTSLTDTHILTHTTHIHTHHLYAHHIRSHTHIRDTCTHAQNIHITLTRTALTYTPLTHTHTPLTDTHTPRPGERRPPGPDGKEDGDAVRVACRDNWRGQTGAPGQHGGRAGQARVSLREGAACAGSSVTVWPSLKWRFGRVHEIRTGVPLLCGESFCVNGSQCPGCEAPVTTPHPAPDLSSPGRADAACQTRAPSP